jgi:serine/threonine protein kinase/WD40 repeat protein
MIKFDHDGRHPGPQLWFMFMASETPYTNLSGKDLLEWFEFAWQSEQSPDFTKVASSCLDEDREWLIGELIKLDLEYRWRQYRTGQDSESVDLNRTEGGDLPAFPVVEDYFRCLKASETRPPEELLLHEYRIRQHYGDSPTAAEFADVHNIRNDQTLRTLDQLTGSFGTTVRLDSETLPSIPGFERIEPIGRGGMGVVYRAWQTKLGRSVALKVIPPHLAKLKEARLRFERESFAAGKILRHPHVATAYDAGDVDGMHYLVIELIEGRDLSRLVKEEGPLSYDKAVTYLKQAASGLAHVHSKGIIHRDIKPSNLMLDEQGGGIRVLDFGLARFNDRNLDSEITQESMTHSGVMMGSVDYMSPEQADDVKSADERSDIYSLGCTLYKVVTGDAMFSGGSVLNRVTAHASKPRPTISSKRSDVPNRLEAIYQKAVAVKPEDRFQSMTEFEAALTTLEESFSATTVSPPQTTSKLRLVAVLALMAVAAITFYGWPETDAVEDSIPSIAGKASQTGNPDLTRMLSSEVKVITLEGLERIPGLLDDPECPLGVKRWQLDTMCSRGETRCIKWSPRGDLIAIASDSAIYIRDAKSLELKFLLLGYEKPVTSLSWHPDGDRLASVAMRVKSGGLLFWDLANLTVSPHGVYEKEALSFSPSGKHIAVAIYGPRLAILAANGDSEAPNSADVGGNEHTLSCAWSPDSQRIAVGCNAGLQIFDVTPDGGLEAPRLVKITSAPTIKISGGGPVAWLDSSRVAFAWGSGLTVVDVRDDSIEFAEPNLDFIVTDLSAHGDEKLLITGMDTTRTINRAFLFDQNSIMPLDVDSTLAPGSCIDWNPNGQQFVVGTLSGAVVVCDKDGKRQAAVGPYEPHHQEDSLWSPSCSRFAVRTYDFAAHYAPWEIWSASGERITSDLYDVAVYSRGVAWNPDGTEFAILCRDQEIRVFSENAVLLRSAGLKPTGPAGYWSSLDWHPTRDAFLIGHTTGSVSLFENGQVKLLAEVPRPIEVALNKDGSEFISTGEDGTIVRGTLDGKHTLHPEKGRKRTQVVEV